MENKEISQWTITCRSCGGETTVNHPPSWLNKIDKDVLFTINASMRKSDDDDKKKMPDPILFQCLKCRKNLNVDGSDRVVKCQYCGANCYLPLEIWRQFHKPPKLSRWMVCFK